MIGLRRIVEAIQKAAQAYGVEKMAAEFDRRPSSLYSELNYHLNEEKKAKLGLLDAVRIMHASGDHSGLHAIAAALGYACTKIEAASAIPTAHHKHVHVMQTVVSFLEAEGKGEDYVRLHDKLAAATGALESIWINRRAESVRFRRRGPVESHAAAPEKKGWLARWRKS